MGLALQILVLLFGSFLITGMIASLSMPEMSAFAAYAGFIVISTQVAAVLTPMSSTAQKIVDYMYYLLAAVAVIFLFAQQGGDRDRVRLHNAEMEYDRAKVAYGFACRELYFTSGEENGLGEYFKQWQPYYQADTVALFRGLNDTEALCLAAHIETQFPVRGPFGPEKSDVFSREQSAMCNPPAAETSGDETVPSQVYQFLHDDEILTCDIAWSFGLWLTHIDDRSNQWIFGSSNNTVSLIAYPHTNPSEFTNGAFKPMGNNNGRSVLEILRADWIFGGKLPGHEMRSEVPSSLHQRFDALANSAAWYMHYLEKVGLPNYHARPSGFGLRLLGVPNSEVLFVWPYLLVCALALRLAKITSELRLAPRRSSKM